MASIFLAFGEDVEDICGKEELVTFTDVSHAYVPDHHVTVKYQLGSRVEASPFDWIGIFPHPWEDVSRPLASISLPYTERNRNKFRQKSVTFSAATVQNLESKSAVYQFVYVDSNRHILGVSAPFQVACRETTPPQEDKASESGAESESESPVVISSTSEDDEEDWEMGNQSLTLRQPDSLADTLEMPGGSSISDLSDIVVLSTSPSREAARLQEEQGGDAAQQAARVTSVFDSLGWSTVSSNGIPDAAGNQNMGSDVVQKDKNYPRVKASSDSTQSELSAQNVQARTTPEKRIKVQIHTSPLTGNKASSLLSQLKFVSSPLTSDDENGEIKRTQESMDPLKERHRPKLITVMQESVTRPKPSSKTKTGIVKAVEHTEPSDKYTTSLLYTQSFVEETANSLYICEPTKKSKKIKKKLRRDKKRRVDLSDDEQMKTLTKPDKVTREESNVLTRPVSKCYEDEVLTGWSVGDAETPELFNKTVVFDELTSPRTDAGKCQTKSTAHFGGWIDNADIRKDTNVLKMTGGGVLFHHGPLIKPVPISTLGITSFSGGQETAKHRLKKKPKGNQRDTAGRQRKHKQKAKRKDQQRTESPALNSLTLGDEPACQTHLEPTHGEHEQRFAEEFGDANKFSLRAKAEASRKVKRTSSRTRKLQLSREFQYLFSLEAQPPVKNTGASETKSETASSPLQTSRNLGQSAPALQDTSEDGFPALPSQKNSAETGPDSHHEQLDQETRDGQSESCEAAAALEEEADDDEGDDGSCATEGLLSPRVGARGQLSPRVGARGELLPYVPPYVLDMMDALPPASVSPDGRAMVEWRRALLPFMPKHALPVFHNKYRTKFARKHELRRLRLRRVALGRNSGIIDRIRHQLALPDTPDNCSTKRWHKLRPAAPQLAGGTESEEVKAAGKEMLLLPQTACTLHLTHQPSYASVVKKSMEPNKDKTECNDSSKSCRDQGATELSTAADPQGVSVTVSGDHMEEPCLALVPAGACPAPSSFQPKPIGNTFKSCLPDSGENSVKGEGKASARVARNFPKEFANYTSRGGGGSAASSPSQLQVIPFCPYQAHGGAASAASMERDTSWNLSWPAPRFIHSNPTASQPVHRPESLETSLLPCCRDTPGLHIRPVAKSQPRVKVGSSSPPSKPRSLVKGSEKRKASGPPAAVEQGEVEERKALLDLAFCSCLEDNAQLRTTVSSLEKQLENLKMQRQDLLEQKQKTRQQEHEQHAKEEEQCSHSPKTCSETNKSAHSPKTCSETNKSAHSPKTCSETNKSAHSPKTCSETNKSAHSPKTCSETNKSAYSPKTCSETNKAAHSPKTCSETNKSAHSPKTCSDTNKSAYFPKTCSETNKYRPEQRRVPVCKWAGKLSKLVRTNVKIISLAAKVKDYEQEIASLHNQVNSLKEALQEESQRSSRALTKWFRLKLKVRSLKSIVRELRHESTHSPREPAAPVNPESGHFCAAGTDTHPRSNHALEEQPVKEDWEPPCKRAKLEAHVEPQTQVQSMVFGAESSATPEPPSLKKSPLLLAPTQRPQCLPPSHCPRTPPSLTISSCCSPCPPEGAVFRLFSGQGGESRRKVSGPFAAQNLHHPHQQQQAVVSPMCHNDCQRTAGQPAGQTHTRPVYPQPLIQQPQHHQQTSPRVFPSDQSSRSNGPIHWKRSPPHLPLPTPPQPPVSPPHGNPSCFGVPPPPVVPGGQSTTLQHFVCRPTPPLPVAIAPYPQTCNTPFFPPDPYQIQAWPLSTTASRADLSFAGQRQGPLVSSPWNPLPNHPFPWAGSGGEREPQCPPLFLNQQALLSQVAHRQNSFEMSNHQQPPVERSNDAFQLLENEHNASNAYGRLHNSTRKDGFFKETQKVAGPCENMFDRVPVQPTQTPPAKKHPSPSGCYRSDFLRRLMRSEAGQTRRQPNPYRLFHREEAMTSRSNNHQRNVTGLCPAFSPFTADSNQGICHPPPLVAAEPLLNSPPTLELLPVTDAEACYRNTAAFVELNADGLVEATRQRMAVAACSSFDGLHSNNTSSNGMTLTSSSSSSKNNNGVIGNSNHCDASDVFLLSRLIESQTACYPDTR